MLRLESDPCFPNCVLKDSNSKSCSEGFSDELNLNLFQY